MFGFIFTFLGIVLLIFIIILVHSFTEERREAEEAKNAAQDRYDNARRNWDKRAQELGFSTAGKSIVYKKYSNSDDFYPVYVWVENGVLYEFVAAPTWETQNTTLYTYPENIKKYYFGGLRRIYRTGTQGSYTQKDFSHSDALEKRANASAGLEELYYRKKSLDAAINAPSHTVKYDNRRTIVELGDISVEYRIDAYDVFKRLVPDKC